MPKAPQTTSALNKAQAKTANAALKKAQAKAALAYAKVALVGAQTKAQEEALAQTKAVLADANAALAEAKVQEEAQAKAALAYANADATARKNRRDTLNKRLHAYIVIMRRVLNKEKFAQRHVRSTDVLNYFRNMPGDNRIYIETKPYKVLKGSRTTPLAEGIMLTNGQCVDTDLNLHENLNQWVNSIKRDSSWRKAFFKGFPLEVYRQILIQERPDLFLSRHHNKNRGKINHRDYLVEYIQNLGIQVCTNPIRRQKKKPKPIIWI